MANKTNEQKLRESFLKRELDSGSSVKTAVFRCLGETLMAGDTWLEESLYNRYKAVIDELQVTLDALDSVIHAAE